MKSIIRVILLLTFFFNFTTNTNTPICIYDENGNIINQPCITLVIPAGNIYLPD